jgi:hypothetical protein
VPSQDTSRLAMLASTEQARNPLANTLSINTGLCRAACQGTCRMRAHIAGCNSYRNTSTICISLQPSQLSA